MPVHPSKLKLPLEPQPKTSPCKAEVREGERKPNCGACPFAVKGIPRHKPVRPTIPERTPVGVLLGEGPGNDEVVLGQPFVGMTGEELNLVLAENELGRSRLVVANAMGCMPPAGLRTEPNMRAAAVACRRWMISILKKAVPASGLPTLAMGKWAGYLVTKKARAIGDARGFIRHESKRFDPLILTWHPTFALFRNPWVAADFASDVDRFSRATKGRLEPLPTAIIKPTLQQIESLCRRRFVTLDIETGAIHPEKGWTGKDPTQATLKVIGLGTPNAGYAMWWASTSDRVKDAVRHILADKTILKVLQNGHWFDLRIMRRLGFVINNVMDTRDMRRALSVTSRLSLGYMASVYLDWPAWKEETEDGKE